LRVGLRIDLFEACSAFTRVAACTLALSPYIVTSISRRLQPSRYLHGCSGSFRLEHLPGGALTHWKTPPLHGAHPKKPFPQTNPQDFVGQREFFDLDYAMTIQREGGVTLSLISNGGEVEWISQDLLKVSTGDALKFLRDEYRVCPSQGVQPVCGLVESRNIP